MSISFKTVLILMTLATPLAANQDFANIGYSATAASYLTLPTYGKSAALAGATVAWAENCPFSQANPALLAPVKDYQAFVSYLFMTYDRELIAANVTGPLNDYIALGISVRNLGVGNFDGRDSVGDSTGAFGDNETAIDVSAAGRLVGNISWGITARYLNQTLDNDHANGIGLDIGATWNPLRWFSIGASGLNLGSYLWWSSSHRDPVVPIGKLGLCGMFLDSTLIAEADASKGLEEPLEGSIGAQYTLLKVFALRAGISGAFDYWDNMASDPDYSCGLGVVTKFLGLDYGLVIPASDLGLRHVLTLKVNFSEFLLIQ